MTVTLPLRRCVSVEYLIWLGLNISLHFHHWVASGVQRWVTHLRRCVGVVLVLIVRWCSGHASRRARPTSPSAPLAMAARHPPPCSWTDPSAPDSVTGRRKSCLVIPVRGEPLVTLSVVTSWAVLVLRHTIPVAYRHGLFINSLCATAWCLLILPGMCSRKRCGFIVFTVGLAIGSRLRRAHGWNNVVGSPFSQYFLSSAYIQ